MSSVLSLVDFPRRILVEIILHLNARDRVALANSSKIFHSLVFEEEKLLRYLDFSKDGRLVALSDIRQYFSNENARKHILKVNLRNVNCMVTEQMLTNYIGKALNLVDINIQGTELKDVRELESFLKPLAHVKRLSIDWPKSSAHYVEVLKKPFSTLTYLSVRIYSAAYFLQFVRVLKLCQEVKELRVVQETCSDHDYQGIQGIAIGGIMRDLEIVEFYGERASSFKQYFKNMLPDPEKWTDFPSFSLNGFYLEKNIQVCNDLMSNEHAEGSSRYEEVLEFGSMLSWEDLLGRAIVKSNARAPSRFCCLPQFGRGNQCITTMKRTKSEDYQFTFGSWMDRPPLFVQFVEQSWCLLKIEEAKRLLKNPRYPITYLYMDHSIETTCTVHLLALAFPTLSELHLSNITRSRVSTQNIENFLWNFRESYKNMEETTLIVSDGTFQQYCDASFKMLVDDTPHVRVLTLDAKPGMITNDQAWDLSALDLIPRWKDLKNLRLSSIPIYDGSFLVEIGKQCTYLEKLELYNLGSSSACCYAKELSQMLPYCRNLRDFSMDATNIGQVFKLFMSLAKNLELRRVRLTSSGKLNTTVNLASSVEHLLRSCSKLTTFICIIDGIAQADSDQVTSTLRRLRSELSRPTLQFQLFRKSDLELAPNKDIVFEDSLPPSFPYILEEFSY